MNFRDRARELGMANPDDFGDLDVWLFIIANQ